MPPFRAREVPWRVSAPLYNALVVDERQKRDQRIRERSSRTLRAASLPPRLEAERAMQRHAELEQEEDFDPSPVQVPRLRGQLSARQLRSQSREVAARAGQSWASGIDHTSSQGPGTSRRPGVRSSTSVPSRGRQPQPPTKAPTTEVPDFAARHERLKLQMERQKYTNRYVTQPQPFVFHHGSKSRSQVRQGPLHKDPKADWRAHRDERRVAGASLTRSGSRPDFDRGGHFSVKRLEQPAQAVPPRTTEKVLCQQLATQRRLQEQREREEQKKQQAEAFHEVPTELKLRVQQAVGPVESLDERIDRIVLDKKQGLSRIQREKSRDLQRIQERVNRRPLLMEQADSLVRARRRALFRVRNTLKEAGVHDVNSHFREEELDEFDRAAQADDELS